MPEDFANGPLKEMAGYRNRLIHFYDEISPEELHTITQNGLKDLETFARSLKEIINHPEKIGLTIR